MKKVLLLLVIFMLSLTTLGSCAPRTNDLVEVGFQGEKSVRMIDLGISDETAITIADAICLQMFGEAFMESTVSVVVNYPLAETEYNSEEYIRVSRYEEGVLDSGVSVVIRRSDGKVMRIYPGG